jgi:hypothetical protein
MPMYTFYLCHLGGGSNSFESFNLGADADAPERALKMLADHPSCTYVEVWNGDRPVMVRRRDRSPFRASTEPAHLPAP